MLKKNSNFYYDFDNVVSSDSVHQMLNDQSSKLDLVLPGSLISNDGISESAEEMELETVSHVQNDTSAKLNRVKQKKKSAKLSRVNYGRGREKNRVLKGKVVKRV